MSNNSNIGRIAIRSSNRARKPFNWSHDVNTTATFGEVQPVLLSEIIPNSKVKLSSRKLVRLAPMLSPTFGRIKLKTKKYFVGMSDLTRNFSALMAEQAVARDGAVFQPMEVPHVSERFLSAFALVGARVSLWRHVFSDYDGNDKSSADLYNCESPLVAGILEDLDAFVKQPGLFGPRPDNVSLHDWFNDNKLYKRVMPTRWQNAWQGYAGPALNIAQLFGARNGGDLPSDGANWTTNTEFWIPITNPDGESLFYPTRPTQADLPENPDYFEIWQNKASIDSADLVIPFCRGSMPTNFTAILSATVSSFGKRWLNLLQISGNQYDFDNIEPRSLLPLFAYYKAYFESFGLVLFQKWETTAVARIMELYDDSNVTQFEGEFYSSANNAGAPRSAVSYEWWCEFVYCVGTAFYTEEQDFVSAHLRQQNVSPSMQQDIVDLFANTPNYDKVGTDVRSNALSGEMSQVDVGGDYSGVGLGVNSSNLTIGQLDIELAKRLYKVINRNTIAGKKIADLLKSQGLGAYVDNVASRFLGSDEMLIDIDEVTATSSGFDNKTELGEQGALGIGYDEDKPTTFETNEFGYLIVIASIVPESGYCQAVEAFTKNIRKLDFYNPEFDGLGFELTRKEQVVGSKFFSSAADRGPLLANKATRAAFGFVPTYTKHKVRSNKISGEFALRGTRSGFMQYYLDRWSALGERVVKVKDVASGVRCDMFKTLTPDRFPIATPNMRFIGRFPWFENFNRMFANQGDNLRVNSLLVWQMLDSANVPAAFDFWFRDYDNFLLQIHFNFTPYSPMLEIEDSFETKEEGTVGKTDMSIGKA